MTEDDVIHIPRAWAAAIIGMQNVCESEGIGPYPLDQPLMEWIACTYPDLLAANDAEGKPWEGPKV